jgi:cobalt/nickel transport system permease protein
MSHIHLPDGILPAWLWISGYAVTALLVAILWRGGTATAQPREFAGLGIFAAIMILAMLIEIPPFGFHFNLSVITGIILAPRRSVIAAFIVNLMLALAGHGGITVAGLNTLVLMVEMTAGYYAFGFLRSRMHIYGAGFAATVVGLACGT